MLFDKEVNINPQGGDYSSALQAALEGGYDQVVTMLLDKGADVSAQGRGYGSVIPIS